MLSDQLGWDDMTLNNDIIDQSIHISTFKVLRYKVLRAIVVTSASHDEALFFFLLLLFTSSQDDPQVSHGPEPLGPSDPGPDHTQPDAPHPAGAALAPRRPRGPQHPQGGPGPAAVVVPSSLAGEPDDQGLAPAVPRRDSQT